jgi:hypothetical protein
MDFDTMFSDLLAQFPSEPDLTNSDIERPYELAATGDFERLVRFAEPLVEQYDDASSPEWEMSPIGWIRQVSSAHKRGKIGEELVRAWARTEGLGVGGRGHRGHDCVVAGLKLEVKTSLRWNNDRFVFLGLRDFDYDAVALLGLEPNDFGLWIVPKQLLWDRARAQLRGVGGEGSKWLSFPTTQPPAWLEPWGGSFAQALIAIRQVNGYTPRHQQDLSDDELWRDLAEQIDWPWQSVTKNPIPPDEFAEDNSTGPITHVLDLSAMPAYRRAPTSPHDFHSQLHGEETDPSNVEEQCG